MEREPDMGKRNALLRGLPRVDELMEHPILAGVCSSCPRSIVRSAARHALDEIRQAISTGDVKSVPDINDLARRAESLASSASARSLRRCVNAAGIILHTGLGRAPFSEEATEALGEVVGGYCNVQSDIRSGDRSNRETHVEGLFREITGAEAALVVNNNAAATVLVLNSLAAGKEVVVSRGEMVEIGGSFRIPDIMKLAGARLVEVGCTNRTHLKDYEKAVGENTALLLSVHQSNYRITGFASQVGIAEIAALAKARGIFCAHDLGSGALSDLREYGLPYEPFVKESLAAGADAALFSGDKLLGGPQCGVILGRGEIIARMRKNPFYRAFRVCKLTLTVLESTLRLFRDPDRLIERHRVMNMLCRKRDELREEAEAFAGDISETCRGVLRAEVREDESQVGGGSLAGQGLPTSVVSINSSLITCEELAERLRMRETPIFARIQKDAVLLDPRTLLPGEETIIIEALREISESVKSAQR
ncbi:MAG TPA: L-seryl-tRNA(Sec) selenium transferase [Candidatus Brocadiia bacterium]|nr:L-seryl-tRNA(Sec) selenium transferase [Candidatus Brocadiia bacterium]